MSSHAGATSPSTSSKTVSVVDDEFGTIVCRRSTQARYVRIRVTEDGSIRASLPKRAPLYLVRELVDGSREDIRRLVTAQKAKRIRYHDGMVIGHSHRLRIRYEPVSEASRKLEGQEIVVTLPLETAHDNDMFQAYLSVQVRRALRREAMAYLPRRLRYLADQYGFRYEKERFGNQSGRWGSCSSSGTISLNVALMNLPHELIDYVLIHELAHTRQMNHSPAFWEIVGRCMPEYRVHRKMLKTMSPIC